MEIVINNCYGEFDLSRKAIISILKKLHPNKKITDNYKGAYFINGKQTDISFLYKKTFRTNRALISVVKELGREANTYLSNLKIINIPDDVYYTIINYDGIEHVSEIHRTWS